VRIFGVIILFYFVFTCKLFGQDTKLMSSLTDSISFITKSDSIKQRLVLKHDSLHRKRDSIQNKLITLQYKTQSLADTIPNAVNETVQAGKKKLQAKIDSLSGKMNLQDKINSLESKPKKLQQSATINKMQGIDLPNTDVPLPKEELTLPDTQVKLPEVNQNMVLPDIKTDLPSSKAIDDAKEKASDLSGQTATIQEKINETEKYQEDIKQLKEGAPEKMKELPQQGEQKLMEASGVKDMAGEISKAEAEQLKYAAALQKYRDQKILQEEIKRKASNVANEHILKNMDKVRQAQQFTPAKEALSWRAKVKEVLRKKSTELDNKKTYQRLVPGLTWQVYNKGDVSIDFGLQTGYRLTPRLTAGLGFTYRVAFDKKYEYFAKGLFTYGSRVYTDFMISKGVFAHLEFERMNLGSELRQQGTDVLPGIAYGSYVGLGKHINITRHWRAHVQGLYRIEYTGELPDVNKLSVRFGVDYVFRRKLKKLAGL
jgi:hypothetical protein